jgi:NADP-dependent 3-hydroxy acid dehydrogenase YdfG
MGSNFFHDKVAVVTGASSGIGHATSFALSKQGACVALAARSTDTLDRFVREIHELGGSALALPTDVTRPEQVARLVEETLALWGRVDILISNAGQYIRSPISDLNIAAIERSMAVNYYGHVYAVTAVIPRMLAQKSGHIVLVSSMDAKKGLPPDAPYVSAKFALTGFGEVLRQELYGSGIHVTTVFPGRVDTPMIANLRVPAIQPKLSAETTARAILRAIERRQAEVYLPAYSRLLVYLNVFTPRAADWVARIFHLQGWEAEKKN